MARQDLFVAFEGTPSELNLYFEDGFYWVDNPRDNQARKLWDEFPRLYKTVRGAKCGAARVLYDKIKWEPVK